MSIVPSMTRTQTPSTTIPLGPPTWMQLLLLHLRSQGWGHHGLHKPKHQQMGSVCEIDQCSRMGMTEECPETPRKWTKAARNGMVKGARQTTIWHVMWSNGIMMMMPGTRPSTWSTSITTMTLAMLTVTMNPTPATVRTALYPSQTMLTMMSHPMVQGAYPAKLSNWATQEYQRCVSHQLISS